MPPTYSDNLLNKQELGLDKIRHGGHPRVKSLHCY